MKHLLLFAIALLAACSAPAATSGPTPPAPHPTTRDAAELRPATVLAPEEAVSETFFGQTVVDPYRWMEKKDDLRFVALMKKEGDRARASLDAIPGRKALFERMQKVTGDLEQVNNVTLVNGRYVYEKRPAGSESYQLYVRSVAGGSEKLLVDPTRMGIAGAHVSLDWWSASPDGKYVVYGLSPSGSEDSTASIMAVDTGEVLAEKIDRTQYAQASWLPDSSGFFFFRMREGAKRGAQDYYNDGVSWLHRLRTDPSKDIKILARGMYPSLPMDTRDFPIVIATPGSEYVMGVAAAGQRKEIPVYLAKLADVTNGKAQWVKVGGLEDEIRTAAIRGKELVVLTTKGADRGKILSMSVSAPDLGKAKVAMPESEAVIEDVVAAKDAFYVRVLDGGYGGILRLSDGVSAPVKLPFDGSVWSLTTSTAENGLCVSLTSWLQPFAPWRFDGKGAIAELAFAPRPKLELSGYEATRTMVTARDGTKVPLSILARKGIARNGQNPTLVNAYGAYQYTAYAPAFSPRNLPFLDQGGVLAYAGVRGGGEGGKPWWKAGQKLNKPNTWRDLIDASELLVKSGWTSPQKLGIEGGSAGGITVGRAMTERPDLFTAVISDVGQLNALRAEFSQNGPPNIDEFGTVKDADGFKGLYAMDATQAVKPNTAYPAVLLTCGMNDPRVEPWQSAKMFAHLTKATSSEKPILMRVSYDEGHGMGSTRTQRDAEAADAFAFLLWRAGVAGFQP